MSTEAICRIENCGDEVLAVELCNKHYIRTRKHGDPEVNLKPRSRSRPGASHPRWLPDEHVSYQVIHQRIRRDQGSARNRACINCDRPGLHWAYQGGDPAERLDEQGFIYSIHPEFYKPMCGKCHSSLDKAKNAELLRLLRGWMHQTGKTLSTLVEFEEFYEQVAAG